MKQESTLRYIGKNIAIVLGLVLVSRGIWYLLDELDLFLFGGANIVTAIIGIFVGLLLLWLPEGDLREIENL